MCVTALISIIPSASKRVSATYCSCGIQLLKNIPGTWYRVWKEERDDVCAVLCVVMLVFKVNTTKDQSQIEVFAT